MKIAKFRLPARCWRSRRTTPKRCLVRLRQTPGARTRSVRAGNLTAPPARVFAEPELVLLVGPAVGRSPMRPESVG